MQNVEQISAASKVPVANADASLAGQLKILSERVDARATFEADVEAYWTNRIRKSVRAYRRRAFFLAIISLVFAGWAGAVTALAWDKMEVVAGDALDVVRSTAASMELGI